MHKNIASRQAQGRTFLSNPAFSTCIIISQYLTFALCTSHAFESRAAGIHLVCRLQLWIHV